MALALTITLFTCTFLLLLESFFSKIGAMLVFVLPLSAVSMLLPLLLPGSPLEPGNRERSLSDCICFWRFSLTA